MATKVATLRRSSRIRRKIKSVANGRPRLSVHRSSKNIYVQIIDDAKGHTVAAASTLDKDLKGKLKTGADTAAAFKCRAVADAFAGDDGVGRFRQTTNQGISRMGAFDNGAMGQI